MFRMASTSTNLSVNSVNNEIINNKNNKTTLLILLLYSTGFYLPDDGLANVGGYEEGDAGAEAVALLQQLVQQEHDEAGDEELDDDDEADAEADVGRVAVHAGHDVDDGLAHGDHHAEELLGAVEQGAVLWEVIKKIRKNRVGRKVWKRV